MKKCLLLAITMLNSILLFASPNAGTEIKKALESTPITLHGRMSKAFGAPSLKPGIYKFDTSNKWNPQAVNLNSFWSESGANAYGNGKYYSYTWTSPYGSYKVKYNVFDETNGYQETVNADLGNMQGDVIPELLFFNPTNQKLYAYNHRLPNPKFYEVDPKNGRLTHLDKITISTSYNSIAIDAEGILYATDSNGNLYKVDMQQNKETLIGNTGYASPNILTTTIDRKSGRMFMVFIPSLGSKFELLEINKATAETQSVITFPRQEMFQHIFVLEKTTEADKKTPDAPINVTATYKTPGQFIATLKATVPTLAYDKVTPLTENATIKFLVNDQEVGQATNVAPGAEGTFDYTFPKEGIYWIKAIASNQYGTSPATQAATYAGFDTPKGVTNAKLEIDPNGKYTLNWEAPTKGINNGEINKENLTYKVIRYPENKVENSAVKGTTFSSIITDKVLHDYYFGIIAIEGDKQSEEVRSNHATYGESIRLPFVEEFDNEINWGLHKVLDGDNGGNDGRTWTLETKNSRLFFPKGKNQARDYFFTPAIKMRKGVTYTLSFVAQTGFNTLSYLDVYMMDKQDIPSDRPIEDLATTAKLKIDNDSEPKAYTVTYTAEADGIKHFMLFNYSNPSDLMWIDSYSIFASKVEDAPAEVENMTVTAGAAGILEATISFTAPTKKGNGEQLNKISAIEIYKFDEQKAIKRFENPTPGETLSYTDKTAFQGKNVYRVVAFNENGNNGGVKVEGWVGEDIANQVGNAKAVYDPQTDIAHVTWTAPTTGYHGGYINLATLKYNIQLGISGWSIGDDFITIAQVEKTEFDLNLADYRQFFPESGNALISIIIVPVTSYGNGVPAFTKFYIGDAYPLPFVESFAGGQFTTAPWGVEIVGQRGTVAWGVISGNSPQGLPLAGIAPQDNDFGMLAFYQGKLEVCENRANGPQIDITGAKDPVATFYIFHRTCDKENNYFILEGLGEDGKFYELSDKIIINAGSGWKKHVVHLNEKNANGPKKFRIVLRAKGTANTDFYFDNLQITDGEIQSKYPVVTDLKGTLTEDGQHVDLAWSLPAEADKFGFIGYYIYCDGQKVTKDIITENIYRADVPNDGKAHVFQVQVVYNDADSNLSNEVSITASSSIDSLNANGFRVYTNGNNLHMEGTNAIYHIYSATGTEVCNGIVNGEATITLNQGIYFIRSGNQVTKCIIY